MGLDVSHGAWGGSYGAFNRFRDALWNAAGLEFAPVNGGPPFGTRLEPHILALHVFQEKNYLGVWDEYPADPLWVLIVHSDCDGYIYPDIAVPLANRLEELATKMPTDGAGHLPDPRKATLRFAKGLREAAAAGEALEFY